MIISKNIPLNEIFDKVASSNGPVEERAAILRAYSRHDLRWVVQYMIVEKHEPIHVPEFKYSNRPYGVSFSTLNQSITRIKAALGYLSQGKQTVFEKNIRLVLESVPNAEADLLVNILKGKKIEGVSRAVFKRAFPEYFPVSDQETD